MNSIATSATSSVDFVPTAPAVDYNAICFMLCVTVLTLAWMLTRSRAARPSQTESGGDRVLCFLSLTTCNRTIVNADAVNDIMSTVVGPDVVIAGAFPQEHGDGNVFEFASHDGRVIPHSSLLRSNFEKVNINRLRTLETLRSVLAYGVDGSTIRKATLREVRSFKSTVSSNTWGQIGAIEDKVPVFFTLDGMANLILIMCIQYPGCRAHNFAPTKMRQI